MNKSNPEAQSTNEPSPLRQAVDHCGSIAALARAILIYPNNVAYYLRTGKPVPAEWAIPIEKATQGRVPREVVRPDVFTDAPVVPAPAQPVVQEPALRWKPTEEGQMVFLGIWPVGEVQRIEIDAKRQWAALCRLPGLKAHFGRFESNTKAMENLETAIRYWMKEAFSCRSS